MNAVAHTTGVYLDTVVGRGRDPGADCPGAASANAEAWRVKSWRASLEKESLP